MQEKSVSWFLPQQNFSLFGREASFCYILLIGEIFNLKIGFVFSNRHLRSFQNDFFENWGISIVAVVHTKSQLTNSLYELEKCMKALIFFAFLTIMISSVWKFNN